LLFFLSLVIQVKKVKWALGQQHSSNIYWHDDFFSPQSWRV
jgi:hypothetical protein